MVLQISIQFLQILQKIADSETDFADFESGVLNSEIIRCEYNYRKLKK